MDFAKNSVFRSRPGSNTNWTHPDLSYNYSAQSKYCSQVANEDHKDGITHYVRFAQEVSLELLTTHLSRFRSIIFFFWEISCAPNQRVEVFHKCMAEQQPGSYSDYQRRKSVRMSRTDVLSVLRVTALTTHDITEGRALAEISKTWELWLRHDITKRN